MTNLAIQEAPRKWEAQIRTLSIHLVSASAGTSPEYIGEHPFRGLSRDYAGRWDMIASGFSANPPNRGGAVMDCSDGAAMSLAS